MAVFTQLNAHETSGFLFLSQKEESYFLQKRFSRNRYLV